MAPMNLREAARRTSRSVTTLRRYIRSGRLEAHKRPGRFGPEFFVTEEALSRAGLDPAPECDLPSALPEAARPVGALSVTAAGLLRETVPLPLYQELQMKHEQLLVQYGMVRAGGLRSLELQHRLDTARRELEENRTAAERRRRLVERDAAELRRRLRQAELELEGRALEIAALREKVRALEMLTRNAVTTENIEEQYRRILSQSLRVERLAGETTGAPRSSEGWPGDPERSPEH